MRITGNPSLITDLYELTMAAAYFENGIKRDAAFELFVRQMPPDRGYLILAGLETAIEYLADLHFTPEEISYLRGLEAFKDIGEDFFEYLSRFKFDCDVWAMPEGTIFFPDEPVLRVYGPTIPAQVVETYLLAAITSESMVATKAARVVESARGKPVADFGSRRAHGPEAAVRAARASFIGGCASTSNVYAGMRLGIPLSGTAAHSWTMMHDSEMEAFENYRKVFPSNTVLLIDTYDTIKGAKNAAKLGSAVRGVRIDSGDLLAMSREVRKILDDAGLDGTRIIVSGDLDEYEIARLLGEGAPIDAFGVGTKMVTSNDAPFLSGVYKLVEVRDPKNPKDIFPRMKLSNNKVTYPGIKQVWRKIDKDGFLAGDVISLAGETVKGATPLLDKVMERGRLLSQQPSLTAVRDRAQKELKRLKEPYRKIRSPATYPVEFTAKIQQALQGLREEITRK